MTYVYTHIIELLVKKHGWDLSQIPLVTKTNSSA